MEADLSRHEPVILLNLHQPDTAKNRADALGNGGCQGGRAHTHMEHRHEQQVQHNVHHGGDHQIDQRMAAVAQGMEDAHEDIVHDGEHRTAEIKAEIADRLGHDLFRSAHPPQNGGGKHHTDDAQGNTSRQTEGHIRMDGPAHGCKISGSIVPGDDHACTHGHTVEKAHQHEDQAAGGADRRQGIFADKIAHTPGVKGVIKLLKNISQQNGHGKQEDSLPNRSFRQGIAFISHEKNLLSIQTVAPATIQIILPVPEKSMAGWA